MHMYVQYVCSPVAASDVSVWLFAFNQWSNTNTHSLTLLRCITGEARTEAMVAAKGKATGEDDNDFDSFVEPAGLILSTVIGMMPGEYHDKARLLREAEKMKLPGNPLVRPKPMYVRACVLPIWHLGCC